ncbi:MAG: EF-Tu/IF-2/RF-3 family GTPase [Anaerolineae bacterium]
MMSGQCPQCYGYDVVTIKRGNLFLWIGLSLGVNAVLVYVVFSGAVENMIPWIIGFVLLDTLIMLPLMAALRNRSQYGGVTYRCRACGHTWSETQSFPQEEPTMSETNFAGPSPFGATLTGFRMTVQDVFSIKGRGTVVTGTVESGTITEGAAIEVHGPSGVTQTVVQGIEMFRRTMSQANAGDNVGILLRGVQRDQVQRGDVLMG